ncbi:MAG: hypothetical protein JSS10_08350 [Verrucomicrobia bacterium]|nr:hypothetical protein [Verrucomicrobiota bacterium]
MDKVRSPLSLNSAGKITGFPQGTDAVVLIVVVVVDVEAARGKAPNKGPRICADALPFHQK